MLVSGSLLGRALSKNFLIEFQEKILRKPPLNNIERFFALAEFENLQRCYISIFRHTFINEFMR